MVSVSSSPVSQCMCTLAVSDAGNGAAGFWAAVPGLPRQERIVSNLLPGKITIRKYRLPLPASSQAEKLRSGVREIEGKASARLVRLAILPGINTLVPQGRLVGGTFASTPLCSRAGQTGCVVSYVSYRTGNPPPPGALFGHSPVPGMTVGCVNPAAPGRAAFFAGAFLAGAFFVTFLTAFFAVFAVTFSAFAVADRPVCPGPLGAAPAGVTASRPAVVAIAAAETTVRCSVRARRRDLDVLMMIPLVPQVFFPRRPLADIEFLPDTRRLGM